MTQGHLKNITLMRKAPYYSTLVAIIILIAKIYGWISTNSVSILAALIDSMLDISSSVIMILAMHLSLQPPDDEHRFGHDKIEDLAIFMQSIFFSISGFFCLYSSICRFFDPHPITEINVGINVMIFSTCLTVILLIYQSFVIKKTGSRLVIVDKLHYLTDLLTTIAVIISVYLSSRWVIIDTIVASGISAYIIYNGYVIFRRALKNLIDQEFDDEDKGKIMAIISQFSDDVHAVHELKTRYAGTKPFIQFHIELDGDITLTKAHSITDKIMILIEEIFPGAEVIIHPDPYGIEEGEGYRQLVK